MKTIKTITGIVAIALMTFSFTTFDKIKKEVNTKTSKLTWKGYKVTGSHTGDIMVKSGHLTFENDILTGGHFIIDMTTINVTDLEGEYQNKLKNHLKSNDFFGVSKFPTASLVFTNVKSIGKNSYKVSAKTTIKGKTDNINFNISVYGNKATASLKIDRTKFDIKYGSANFFDGLKDKAIYDEFDIIADLEF